MGDSQVVVREEEKLYASVIINRNPFFGGVHWVLFLKGLSLPSLFIMVGK